MVNIIIMQRLTRHVSVIRMTNRGFVVRVKYDRFNGVCNDYERQVIDLPMLSPGGGQFFYGGGGRPPGPRWRRRYGGMMWLSVGELAAS